MNAKNKKIIILTGFTSQCIQSRSWQIPNQQLRECVEYRDRQPLIDQEKANLGQP
tara:strand:- start:92 stop:256 length:165 start_codon:yes stop_codon:yes gene_type:complete